MVFAAVFALGDMFSFKTKGLISGAILGGIIYIGGYWTGIIPLDSITSTFLPQILSAIIIPCIIVNLGTLISLEEMLKEWKTVVIALVALVGLAVVAFTLGIALFGREYSLCAASPISGGTIAAIITKETADAAGRPELGAYAMLIMSMQTFIGMPASAFMLRREANKLLENRDGLMAAADSSSSGKKKINLRFFPETPPQFQTTFLITAKLAFVAVIGYHVANLTVIPGSSPTNYWLNPNIAYLIFGVLFCEFGFLEKGAVTKAGWAGFQTLALFSLTPNSYTSLTPENLLAMAGPLVGMLIIGSVGLGIGAVVAGKVLKVSPSMSFAIGMCALMGYPGTQIVTDDVVKALPCSPEEKEAVRNALLPKMLVGGFTTVTIASVAFAGVVCPMIF